MSRPGNDTTGDLVYCGTINEDSTLRREREERKERKKVAISCSQVGAVGGSARPRGHVSSHVHSPVSRADPHSKYFKVYEVGIF